MTNPLPRQHTWQEIADRLSEIEGHSVSHQAASDSGRRLIQRLRYKLLTIPEVKDWLIDQGIDAEDNI